MKNIKISGLRGFGVEQYLHFAIPNGEKGSGITILVGANNGGKSTVVEAIRLFANRHPPSFTIGKRNQKTNGKIEIFIDDQKGIRTIETGGSECEWINVETNPCQSIFVVPSRRYFSPFFGKGLHNRNEYISAYGLPTFRGSSIEQFANRLFQIQNNREKFDSILSKVINPLPNWSIDQSDSGQYFLKFDSGKSFHNSDGLGEGFISLFFIIDALYDSNPNDVIVIDEPELSLHPSLQKKLCNLILAFSKDRQIIYATHSPYFVSFMALFNGAKIARIYKNGEDIIIANVKDSTKERLKGFYKNYQNPHILGLNACEIFFQEDAIMLVEGQDDVVYYDLIARELLKIDLKGNFFGWGVGGADNMETIATLLVDLGFEKVVGIVDFDKKNLVEKLENTFPKYKFFYIPANDIRTKPEVKPRKKIEGLLDEKREIRSEYKEKTEELFKKINSYFELTN